METNSQIPLTPPSPSQATLDAPQEKPKRTLNKLLLALFILFILFDIGIGAYLLLGKNKNQSQPEAKDITNNPANTNSEKCDFIKNIEKKTI